MISRPPEKKQASIRRFYVVVAFAVVVGPLSWWGLERYAHYSAKQDMIESSPDTPLSNRLILPYGEQPYRLAQQIERGDVISEAEVKALPEGVDQRYGDEITMLFLALGAHNLQAIDTLLAAGADPYLIDRPSTGSTRNFVYYLAMPGPSSGPVQGFDFENRMIESYLKYGGKANVQLPGNQGNWLVEQVGLIGNYEGVKILLKAGADPWAENAAKDTLMSTLAISSADTGAIDFINWLIQQGYLNSPMMGKLQKFMRYLAAYTQRGDKISKEIQQTALRVLKCNPDYPPDQNTQDIFGGPIPWKEVENAD
ncbi:hypothetical protein [Martelella sp. AMO21009]